MHDSIVVNPNIWACYLWQIKTTETKMTSIFRQRNPSLMFKEWSVFFTELAIQNACFCIQHEMLVTLESLYISLQFLFVYGSFNSILNTSVYFISNDVVVNEWWIGKDVIVVPSWFLPGGKFFKNYVEIKFVCHVSVSAKM